MVHASVMRTASSRLIQCAQGLKTSCARWHARSWPVAYRFLSSAWGPDDGERWMERGGWHLSAGSARTRQCASVS